MSAGRITRAQLDAFVAECDRLGGPQHPGCAAYLGDFSYAPSTTIDDTLDPFSPRYLEQQLALYQEIAGRQLDQVAFEQAGVDVDERVAGANPWASDDPGFVVPHALAVLQAVWLAKLPPKAKVLDMGCGLGMSTELLEFIGAEVTSVDINPTFLEVVKQRAAKRQRAVNVVLGAFEDVDVVNIGVKVGANVGDGYDAVLFYECLHHAVRPWVVIEKLVKVLKPEGKIILSGEPVQRSWWKTWGLRLDPVSVYCIHKHGWFESGWSKEFLTACFTRAGLRLQLYPGLGLGTGAVGIASRGAAESWWDHEGLALAAASFTLKAARAVRRDLSAPGTLLRRVRDRLR